MNPTTYARHSVSRRLFSGTALATATVAMMAGTAMADRFAFDEIVVTAQHREQALQRTPIAVTALTGFALDRANITDLRGLGAVTPGLTITGDNQLGTNPVSIRGIGSAGGGIGTDDPVAIYVNGVYLGRPAANTFDLVDMERVEVLRGPQGTLYGRNATGGAINLVTKRPSLDGIEAYAEAGYGNLRDVRGRTHLSAPVTENLGFSMSASYSNRRGWGENIYQGTLDVPNEAGVRLHDLETAMVRAAALYAIDRLDIMVAADYGIFNQSVALKSLAAGLGDPDEYNINAPAQQDREFGGVSATINYELTNEIKFTSISAYRESKYDEAHDSDGTPVQFLKIQPDESQHQWSQEVRLAGAHNDRLDWIVGLYYFRESSEWNSNAIVFASPHRRETSNKTDSYAAFGEVTYGLTDRLNATAGIRYSREKKSYTHLFGLTDGLKGPYLNPGMVPQGDSETWNAWTPKFGLDFLVTDDVFVYASASRGFKSGGFNLTSISSFDPEFIWAYEVGLKASFLDNRLQANLSAFYYDYKDLQLRVSVLPGLVEVVNAATSEIKGVEFEFTALPAEGLMLNGSVAYLDATYDEFLEPIFDTMPGSPTQGQQIGANDFGGNYLNRSPKWKINLNGEYTLPLGNVGNLTLRGEYVHEARMYFTAQNVAPLTRGSTDVFNARIIYEPTETFTVTGYMENIGNKRYVANAIPIAGDTKGFANVPRLYGVRLAYRY